EDDTEPETKTSLPKIKKTSITTLKNNAKSKVTVKCKMVMDADYYQIQYSLNKKFTKKQTKSKTLFANTKTTLKGLKKGKTYYVRVRAYCITLDGKKVYGKFSNVKKIKIKK
ncbi:MAG: fibronectin type III domain-containing protein, partial [Lachnospiraceae bacterium]|nr:fibronectin type III domain-containing protein [Lachnospiraceae bacterium]